MKKKTKKKSKGPSAQSKRQDQLWISRDELTPGQRKAIGAGAKAAARAFNAAFSQHPQIAGTRSMDRLRRTAKRAGMEAYEYALFVLLK